MPSRDPQDPLDAVLRPPLDESPDERARRLAREAEALRISHEIDEQIKRERVQRKKKQIVRLLLLGQSESGKSTTLRQFQRLYTPSAFRDERILWRSVIQLNVVRSISTILDAIADVRLHNAAAAVSSASETSDDDRASSVRVPLHLETLAMRLLPLRHVEALLVAKLVPPSESEAVMVGWGGGMGDGDADADGSGFAFQDQHYNYNYNYTQQQQHYNEVFVRPGATWKTGMLGRARTGIFANHPHSHSHSHPYSSHTHTHDYGRPYSAGTTGQETQDESQQVLHEMRDDIVALWKDKTVREILKRRKIRLEESPGFFLNDLHRITALDYSPSDDDVFKARLKTVGVCEYKFEMEAGFESGTEWRIIDVGGSRSQVTRWVPYFDDVDAIIFLVPISAFDQTLVEDKSVNRLEDSVFLWKAVCSNTLLAKVELILFMNKCDILDQKLRSGIRLAKYLRSFGDRPNDLENAQKFFRGKFSFIHREHSPQPRKFHGYATSVTDASTTSGILVSVRDMVMREHLRKAKLLP